MKKFLTIIFLSVFFSFVLSAASVDTLQIGLNLASNPIELFGITAGNDSGIDEDYATAISLVGNGNEPISLNASQTDPTATSKAYFSVWWYIYSPKTVKIYINYDPLTNGDVKIPYSIKDERDNTYESSETTNIKDESTLIKTLNSPNLDYGQMIFTIPSFDILELGIANYTSTITISILSTT